MSIYNQEAEQGVLGACLIGTKTSKGVAPLDIALDAGCDSTWFQSGANKLAWEAMVRLHTEGKPVDMLSVGEAINDFSKAEALMDACATATNLEYYLDLADKAQKLRKLDMLGRDLCAKSTSDDVDVGQLIAEASQNLTDLNATKEAVSVETAMNDNITVLNNAADGIVAGVPLPWESFSNHIGGLQRASVCPIVGRDGKGKSGAVCQMLDFWAGEGIPAVSFSMEDVARRTLLRMAGCREWFSAREVESGKVCWDGRWQTIDNVKRHALEQKLVKYRDWLMNRPFWIDDNKYTVEQLCSKIRHYHRVYGIQVAAIDGFKDIVHSKGESETAKEKHIAQELFKVAKDLDISIPVVSHITKIMDDVPITKENIKGSGTQFQGARQVLIFQDAGVPQITDDHTFVMSCTKNNYGSGGSVVLRRDEHVLSYSQIRN